MEDGEVFAYASGGRFFRRVADDEVWAYETANYLYSARSGRPLVYRIGNVYHDAERHVARYYESYADVPLAVSR